MKLLYCAYNLMDQEGPPDWSEKLRENPVVQREGWTLYSPYYSLAENIERNPKLLSLLQDDTRVSPRAQHHQEALRLDPLLVKPLASVQTRLMALDLGPAIDIPFKSLYVLLRSDLVLVDLNCPGHGEAACEVVMAYLLNVPVVGIGHRFILNPWIVSRVKSVIFPKTTDEIVQQVLAYDPGCTAEIEKARAEVTKQDEPSPAALPRDPVPGTV